MFDKIVFISDYAATIKLKEDANITMNLMNLHLVFEDETKKVLGEIEDINGDTVKASFLGEIVGDRFLGGTIRKPRLDAKIRVINNDEILLITGKDELGYMKMGTTPFYEGAPVFLDVNNFFSGHFAIMGNSGSGKSCGISRLFQNMFHDKRLNPCYANIIMFDSSGEYYNAFSNLNSINPNYHYRFISTNEKESDCENLRIPIYLLNEDDLALLLQVTNHSQLPIVERMRKLALVFSQKDVDANNYKNHLIAKAIMTILYTNETAPNKRNEVFSVLASCSTPQFNLEAIVQGIGYTRKFRECFLIDNSGNFSESVLLTEYVSSFIDDELDAYEPQEGVFYTLDTLEKALNFTLISEGWLRNKNTYGDAVTLKVRLHSLIVSGNAKFFDVDEYVTVEQYLMGLVNSDGKKYQFVNINLDDVDDDFAKVITKIFSRLIFDFSKGLTERASMPFHLVVEEAHRYIQNDTDRFLIGYNIFERIAKEGRKYGVILGIITQRPVELSDTVISQCSNFLIFKMNHPVDVDYIRKMVPNISDEIVEKQKTLQAGTCLGFGGAFRIPMIVRMEMPDPAPWSGNCDVVSFWGGGSATSSVTAPPIARSVDVSVGGVSVVPSVAAVPSDMNNNELVAPLVKMNEVVEEKGLVHAGEFGLLGVDETVKNSPNLPVTDTGKSLVTLAGSNNNNSSNEVVPLPSVKQVSTNVASSRTHGAPVETNNTSSSDSGTPLVSFLGGGHHENIQYDHDLTMNSTPALVSFNNEERVNSVPAVNSNSINSANSMLADKAFNSNASNETGASVVSNVESSGTAMPNNLISFNNSSESSVGHLEAKTVGKLDSNITAAPEVDITSFANIGIDDEETEELDVPSSVSFANTSAPGDLNPFVTEKNITEPSKLVNLNTSVASNEQPKDFETLSKKTKLNDTFDKPDLSDFNTGGQMIQASSFVPMNNSGANDGFVPNIPNDMNFGVNQTDSGSDDALSFNTGSSLVSFLDKM